MYMLLSMLLIHIKRVLSMGAYHTIQRSVQCNSVCFYASYIKNKCYASKCVIIIIYRELVVCTLDLLLLAVFIDKVFICILYDTNFCQEKYLRT